MLVDDHEIVRTGLRSFLEAQEGFKVVAEASSGVEAVERVTGAQPDLIIMDISMPGMDGLETTRRLKQCCPDVQVLALTVHSDKQYLFEMMAAGASGYITKQAAAEELVAAVRAVANGSIYLQPALARWLLEDYRRLAAQEYAGMPRAEGDRPVMPNLDVLSQREQQVVLLVSEGLTNPQIGEKLGISPKTVARHRERIMDKLNMHSSAELVRFAVRTGLIDVE
jgi:two-component system response regulator NreC